MIWGYHHEARVAKQAYNLTTMPVPYHPAVPIAFHPNYFFICPNCGKRIEVIIYFEKVDQKPDAEIFLKCLPPGGCKWSGELPMFKGAPIPGVQRTTS
jgi:hypothetical protein